MLSGVPAELLGNVSDGDCANEMPPRMSVTAATIALLCRLRVFMAEASLPISVCMSLLREKLPRVIELLWRQPPVAVDIRLVEAHEPADLVGIGTRDIASIHRIERAKS